MAVKKKVKVRFKRALAGPRASFRRGKDYMIDEKWAKSLEKGGSVEILPELKGTKK